MGSATHVLLESCDSIHPCDSEVRTVALSRDEVYERVKVALVDKLGTDESAISEDAAFRRT
jgi:hypothetical protein